MDDAMLKEFNDLKARLEAATKTLDEKDARLTKLAAEVEAKAAAIGQGNFQAPATRKDDRSEIEKGKDGQFSFGAFIRGICLERRGLSFQDGCAAFTEKGSRDWRDAGFTAAICQKVMSTTTGSGGYFAPEEWSTQWVNVLAAKTVCIPAGIERWQGLSNVYTRMGRLATGATGVWIGEGSSITLSSPTDEQISVTPHEAAARIQISNQLLKLSNPAIATLIGQNMQDVLARLVDLAILEGTGSGSMPSGIFTNAGSTVSCAGAVTWAKLEEFMYDLALNNCPMQKVVWFMHPRTFSTIRQLTSSTYPLFVGTPQAEAMRNTLAGGALLGYPVYQSSQMSIVRGTGADGSIYLGDMSELVLADWGPPEFAASSEIAFDTNSTQLRALWLVDVAAKHWKSFAKCVDTTS